MLTLVVLEDLDEIGVSFFMISKIVTVNGRTTEKLSKKGRSGFISAIKFEDGGKLYKLRSVILILVVWEARTCK